MLKKIILAFLITASSFGFTVTEAEEYDADNYCCGNYYDNDCCDYGNDNRDYGRHGHFCR